MLQKILQFFSGHKIISVIILAALVWGGYYSYKTLSDTSGEIRYVLVSVEKGTISSTISGTGQVSVSQQVDVKAKAAGDAISVAVKNEQAVNIGAVLIQLDAREAQKTVRDAKLNLKSARLALKKLKKPADKLSVLQAENALSQAKRELADLQSPPDPLELMQAENALAKAKEAAQEAEDNLEKAYEDGFNAVANAFLDLQGILTGLDDIFFDATIAVLQSNIDWYANQVVAAEQKAATYKRDVSSSYKIARNSYDASVASYKSASRTSAHSVLEKLVSDTYETTKAIADVVKNSSNYLDLIKDDLEQRNVSIPTILNTHRSSLDTYTSKTNSHLSSLLSVKTGIESDKVAIEEAKRSVSEKTENLAKLKKGVEENDIQTVQEKISEKQESLAKLKAGTDPLDIQSQEFSVKQKENALADAKDKLADYSVRAPFNGTVAKILVKKGDSISSGAVVATLITTQRVAEISLNEVDVARVKVGQKATLTFDAVPDLNITGQVAEIDAIGTVSQGVVSYNVKITFDTQDERVKPSMSVSADIIIEAKVDVLIVPNSAVKSQGNSRFVEVPADRPSLLPAGRQDSEATSNSLPQDVLTAASGVVLSVPPRRQPVEIGIENDESTEIVSGLKEKDIVVTNTINPNAKTAVTNGNQQGGFRIPGMGGPPGGFR